jgi:hypothetical protein
LIPWPLKLIYKFTQLPLIKDTELGVMVFGMHMRDTCKKCGAVAAAAMWEGG